MKLTKQVYKWPKNRKNARPVVTIDMNQFHRDFVLDFSICTWVDQKYSFVKPLMGRFQAVLTDSDLLGCAGYIEAALAQKAKIILYVDTSPTSPSKLRVRRAYEKMKSAGVDVVYRANRSSAEAYVSKMKST